MGCHEAVQKARFWLVIASDNDAICLVINRLLRRSSSQ